MSTAAPTAVDATSDTPAPRTAPPEPAREPPVREPPVREPPARRAPAAAPAAGGPEQPAGLDDVATFALRLGAEAVEVRLAGQGVRISRPAFEIDLRQRGLSLPGIQFTRLVLNRGANGVPTGGTLYGDISAPFVRGSAHLTVDADGNLSGGADAVFAVEILGNPHVTFNYVDRQWTGGVTIQGRDLRLPIPNVTVSEGQATVAFAGDQLTGRLTATFQHATLGNGTIDVTMSNRGVDGRGGFVLTMPLLAGSHGDFSFVDNKLAASLALTAAAVQVPVPGVSLTNLTGNLELADGHVSGGFGFVAAYAGLATLTLAQATFSNRGVTGARGTIDITAPPVAGSHGTFLLDAQGRPSGSLTITSDRIPIPVLRRGSITVTLRQDGGVDVAGAGRIELGPVGGGDFSVSWVNGVLRLGADVNFLVRPLPPITGHVEYVDGDLSGEVSTQLAIGPLSGIFVLRYAHGIFSGEATLAYAVGRFNGRVHVIVDPEGHISGDGEAVFRLADWLTGTIGLVVLPDLNVDAHGELAFPDQVTLFDAWRFERNFFHFEQDFPLWGITIPVVGSIGLVATVHANAGFRAAFGPGTLRNIRATGDISTRPDAEPAFSLSGDFNIPAGAEIVIVVGGGIALGALVAKIEGGIDLSGIAGIYGGITLTPTFAYRNGQYMLSGTALLAAAAQLRARIDAYAAVEVGIGWLSKEVWRHDWNLAEWIFDTGWNIGLRAGIDYTLGQSFAPELHFDEVQVDPTSIIHAAIPNSGDPVPAPARPPAPQASFQPAEGDPGTVAAAPPPAGGGAPAPAGAPSPHAPPPPAGTAPPGGGPAPAPATPTAPGAPSAPAAGQAQPQIDPPVGETEPPETRPLEDTYLTYVYDSLSEVLPRKAAPAAPPEHELKKRLAPPAKPRPKPPKPPVGRPELRKDVVQAEPPPAEHPKVETPARGRSAGKPLAPVQRERLEQAFDADLSHVRVHTDEHARESARLLGAEAYTAGDHVYFGHSRSPNAGHEPLLAHELTHVLQERAPADAPLATGHDQAEAEAHEAGEAVERGEKPKPVKRRREAVVHRVGTPSAPAAPAPTTPPAGAAPTQGPGPHRQFNQAELRRILSTPGDERLEAAKKQLMDKETLWKKARQEVWTPRDKKWIERPPVEMRFPSSAALPRRNAFGDVQVAVGDVWLRHGQDRETDSGGEQAKMAEMIRFGEPLGFTRTEGRTREDTLAVYRAFQERTNRAKRFPIPDTQPGQVWSGSEVTLGLNATGFGAMWDEGWRWASDHWERPPQEPAQQQGPQEPDLDPVTRGGLAVFQAHHVVPMWLTSADHPEYSRDNLRNLAPWHRDFHQTNHSFHQRTTQLVKNATDADDYRDFKPGTLFKITELTGGTETSRAAQPNVEVSQDEKKFIPRPAGALWWG